LFIYTLVAISKKLQIRARKNRDVYNCFVIVDSEGLSNLFYKASANLLIRRSLINQRNRYVIVNKKVVGRNILISWVVNSEWAEVSKEIGYQAQLTTTGC